MWAKYRLGNCRFSYQADRSIPDTKTNPLNQAANPSEAPASTHVNEGPVGVIIQPSYIPWRGYFHMIQRADVFVFYDDVQYDKRGWRNRNKIKTPQGAQWLTIPVHNKGAQSEDLPINEIEINWDAPWNKKQWATIKQNYQKAPFFAKYAPLVESLFERHDQLLADLTIESTILLAKELGINDTQFVRSSSLEMAGQKTERLISVLQKVGAKHYISGPSARDYMQPELFEEAGITFEYQVYDYPEYAQRYPPFDGQVSILDLLFNEGPQASDFIWKSSRP